MNTNVMGKEGYYATVTASDGISWGFIVSESRGNILTVELAEEMLSWANTEYKKGCPEGYWKEGYDSNRTFTKLKYDMTDYRESVSYTGDDITIPVGKKKIGTYDKEKKILRIYEDDLPIYENNNGVICRDQAALADSLM